MEEVKSLVSTTPVLLLTVSLLFGYFLLMWIFDKKHNNLPPGPRGWRDNLTFLKASMDGTLKEKVSEWAEKYGELTFVDCLGTRMLFLNTSRVARKIMASDEYKFKVADRKQTATTRLGFNGKDLMFTENDAIQKKKRRLFGQVMGVFGDGTDKLENAVQRETDKLLKTFAQHDGEDYDMSFALSQALINILYLLVRT